jgi:hypothetical protein
VIVISEFHPENNTVEKIVERTLPVNVECIYLIHPPKDDISEQQQAKKMIELARFIREDILGDQKNRFPNLEKSFKTVVEALIVENIGKEELLDITKTDLERIKIGHDLAEELLESITKVFYVLII